MKKQTELKKLAIVGDKLILDDAGNVIYRIFDATGRALSECKETKAASVTLTNLVKTPGSYIILVASKTGDEIGQPFQVSFKTTGTAIEGSAFEPSGPDSDLEFVDGRDEETGGGQPQSGSPSFTAPQAIQVPAAAQSPASAEAATQAAPESHTTQSPNLADQAATSALIETLNGIGKAVASSARANEATAAILSQVSQEQKFTTAAVKDMTKECNDLKVSFETAAGRLSEIVELGPTLKTLANTPATKDKGHWMRGVIIAAIATIVVCTFVYLCTRGCNKAAASGSAASNPAVTAETNRHASTPPTPPPALPQAVNATDAPDKSIAGFGHKAVPKKEPREVIVQDLATGRQFTRGTPLTRQTIVAGGQPVYVDNRLAGGISNCHDFVISFGNVNGSIVGNGSGSTIGNTTMYAPPLREECRQARLLSDCTGEPPRQVVTCYPRQEFQPQIGNARVDNGAGPVDRGNGGYANQYYGCYPRY